MTGPGTSFQFPALIQKHVTHIHYKIHLYFTKFHFDSTRDSKEISKSVTTTMQQCF